MPGSGENPQNSWATPKRLAPGSMSGYSGLWTVLLRRTDRFMAKQK